MSLQLYEAGFLSAFSPSGALNWVNAQAAIGPVDVWLVQESLRGRGAPVFRAYDNSRSQRRQVNVSYSLAAGSDRPACMVMLQRGQGRRGGRFLGRSEVMVPDDMASVIAL